MYVHNRRKQLKHVINMQCIYATKYSTCMCVCGTMQTIVLNRIVILLQQQQQQQTKDIIVVVVCAGEWADTKMRSLINSKKNKSLFFSFFFFIFSNNKQTAKKYFFFSSTCLLYFQQINMKNIFDCKYSTVFLSFFFLDYAWTRISSFFHSKDAAEKKREKTNKQHWNWIIDL